MSTTATDTRTAPKAHAEFDAAWLLTAVGQQVAPILKETR